MLRRTFLQSAVLASALQGAETPIRLGFDTFSIRGFKWKALQLLDYAASLKLDAIQMSSLDDFESLEPAYLAQVKEKAARHGIQIDTGLGSVCPTASNFPKNVGTAGEYIERGLRVTHALGVKVMRCYMGSQADRRGKLPLEAHMENVVKVLRGARPMARDWGIRIGLENHAGDMQAREVKTIIEAAGKDVIGSCLDSGNPLWVAEDPFLTLETLAPYVVTTHIRDSAVFEHPRGAATQWLALGDGSIDFQKFVSQFRKTVSNSSVHLEIITGRKPEVLNYLEPEYWKPFPNTPAWEFARFVALAKSGRPYIGPMLIAPPGKPTPVIEAALIEQQRTDLERSIVYAQKTLGLGIRWRG